ncbi:hypothetical protein LCGC14_2508940 [marine sediment metagenome]|uniref:ZZ-type domain-containing protein n=1 Tax=marine sediment metagenome TaxID=412755 RepID=A0A0F9DT78_9ZZZZ
MSDLPKECYVVYGVDDNGEDAFVLAAFSKEADAYEYLRAAGRLDYHFGFWCSQNSCDICDKKLDMIKLNMMRCCDYDECIECFEKAEHQKHDCELVDLQKKYKEIKAEKIIEIRETGCLSNNAGYYKVACVTFNVPYSYA